MQVEVEAAQTSLLTEDGLWTVPWKRLSGVATLCYFHMYTTSSMQLCPQAGICAAVLFVSFVATPSCHDVQGVAHAAKVTCYEHDIRTGDIDALKSTIDVFPDLVHHRGIENRTPLMLAASVCAGDSAADERLSRIMRILVTSGVDVQAKDDNGQKAGDKLYLSGGEHVRHRFYALHRLSNNGGQ